VSRPAKRAGVRIESFSSKALTQLSGLLAPTAITPARTVAIAPVARFTKVSAAGALLPDSATEWVAVYDREQDLVFSRSVLDGTHTWAKAKKAAEAAKICGVTGWRMPTVMERFRICDHSRVYPALPIEYFNADSGWEWTSTVDAESPSDDAWSVGLSYGNSGRHRQGCDYHVRAVRAGQLFGFCTSGEA